MNVYDFDGTIYDGDSGNDFIIFMLTKKTFYMTKFLFKFLKKYNKYLRGKIDFKEMKSSLYSFVSNIENLSDYVEEFAEKNKNKLKKYYKEIRKEDDIVVSASLDFYLLPLCSKIGLKNVICTRYDIKKGEIINENCKGVEKVNRFNLAYGKDTTIDNYYGDSKADIPMLDRAQNGFFVKGNKVINYKEIT